MLGKEDFQKIFESTYHELIRFLYYYCGSTAVAEDIAQDTYVKFWEKRNELTDKNTRGLLFTMAKNQWLNQVKHNKIVLNFQKQSLERTVKTTPEYLLEEKEFSLKLEATLAEMNEKQRVVFLLNRLEKKKYREIAEDLQISIKTVEKRMGLAISFLQKRLGKRL